MIYCGTRNEKDFLGAASCVVVVRPCDGFLQRAPHNIARRSRRTSAEPERYLGPVENEAAFVMRRLEALRTGRMDLGMTTALVGDLICRRSFRQSKARGLPRYEGQGPFPRTCRSRCEELSSVYSPLLPTRYSVTVKAWCRDNALSRRICR
jgi:hypothetical protein